MRRSYDCCTIGNVEEQTMWKYMSIEASFSAFVLVDGNAKATRYHTNWQTGAQRKKRFLLHVKEQAIG